MHQHNKKAGAESKYFLKGLTYKVLNNRDHTYSAATEHAVVHSHSTQNKSISAVSVLVISCLKWIAMLIHMYKNVMWN